jgi:hypothetical protein
LLDTTIEAQLSEINQLFLGQPLREASIAEGVMERSNIFNNDPKYIPEREGKRDKWFDEYWDKICLELRHPESPSGPAMAGHLSREFFYYFGKEESDWMAAWDIRPKKKPPRGLPAVVIGQLVIPIKQLSRDYNIRVEESVMNDWLAENIATHFWSFADYYTNSIWRYLPAHTRSSLRFLTDPVASPYTRIEELVMPFVGLAALRRVRHRRDLVKGVLDWSVGDGLNVVNGLRQLADDFINLKSEKEKGELLDEVRGRLTGRSQFEIFRSNATTFFKDWMIKVDINDQAGKATAEAFSPDPSRGWLWDIHRASEDWERPWRPKLDALVEES